MKGDNIQFYSNNLNCCSFESCFGYTIHEQSVIREQISEICNNKETIYKNSNKYNNKELISEQ